MSRKFTLVELLVVVAIIGILTSMLLPAVAKGREKSKQSVCINQLKSCGTMVIMSLGDQNEFYHAPNNTSTGTHYNPLWSKWLMDYVAETTDRVFMCPNKMDIDFNGGWGGYASRYTTDATPRIEGSKGGDINFSQYDSSVWLMGDGRNSDDTRWHRMTDYNDAARAQPWMLHLERGNILFVDGSVRSMTKSSYASAGFTAGWSMSKTAVSF